MTKAILLRFVRGFLAAGIASITAQLAIGVTVSSVEDLKKLGISLAVAFISGGLMAIDKLIRFKDELPVTEETPSV
jgi:hypothetical protein